MDRLLVVTDTTRAVMTWHRKGTEKRTVPAGLGSPGACLLREACLLGSFGTTGLAGDLGCDV